MADTKRNDSLPAIPDKQYFSISEVSALCGVKSHILRYWEQEFPQLKPMKRRGNRRHYQRQDLLLIRQIRTLLHQDGLTIQGARKYLSGSAARQDRTRYKQLLREMIHELRELKRLLRQD